MSVKVSTKCRYGTRAVTEIAKAWPQNTVKKRQISKNQSIPASYLENILLELKSAGLVEATRGAHGGYRLTRSPESIQVIEIMRAFGDPFVPTDCVRDPERCERASHCSSRKIWVRLHKAQEQALSSITVRDLLDESFSA